MSSGVRLVISFFSGIFFHMKLKRSFLFPLTTLLTIILLTSDAFWFQTMVLSLLAVSFWLTTTVLGIFSIRMNFFIKSVNTIGRNRKEVLLTFDDGPDPVNTERILKILRARKIKAVFFVIGEKADKSRELIKKISDEGHEIGCHSQSHDWFINFLIGKRLNAEIENGCSVIKEVTGSRPRLYRPPVGLTNPHLFSSLSRSDLVSMGWSFRSYDTKRQNKKKMLKRLEKLKNGTILLFHDGHTNSGYTADILEEIIGEIIRQGFRFALPDSV